MQKKKRNIIKKIVAFVAIFFAVIVVFWSVIIGLVATPQVITPQIQNIAQQYIKSDFSIKSVDLSLFDRFPNITLRIDSLRISQTKDSIGDLLFARQCRIAIDPVALLFKNVVINHFSLRDASMYVYVDSLHGPLKTFNLPEDLLQEEQPDSLDVDSDSDFDFSGYTLSIKRCKLDSINMVIDDRTRRFYTRVDNYNLNVSMSLSSSLSNLDVVTGFDNMIVWSDGDLLVKKTSMELRSKMKFDMDSMKLSFDRARIKLNGIDLKTRGVLQRDTTQAGGILVDIHSSLNTPSLSEFLALVPGSIIDGKDKITTQGSVALDMEVKGLYSEESMPTLGASLKIEDAKAKYASRKLSLESVNCDAYMFVDMNNPKNSYSDIAKFQINTSEIIDLNFNGKITNMIEDPKVDLTIKSTIDFDRFTEVFPLNESIIFKGSNKSDFKTQFTLSDIEKSNFANLYIDGESSFEDLSISVDASKFIEDTTAMSYLYLQAERGKMLFGDNVLAESNSRTLRSRINFSGLGYKSKSGEYLTIKDVEVTMGANFDRKTSAVNGVGVRGVAKNMEVGIDSLFSSHFESSDATITLSPKSENSEARLTASITSEHITAHEPSFNSDIELSSVEMNFMMLRLEKQLWDIDGTVSFSDFGMFSDLFPLEVKVPQTKVSVDNRTIYLNDAHMTIGNSSLSATGHINDMLKKMLVEPRTALSGELAIAASYVDFSELIEASNSSVLMMDEEETLEQDVDSVDSLAIQTLEQVAITTEPTEVVNPTDSTDMQRLGPPDSQAESALFLVPRRVDFAFDLNIDKARLEDAIIEDVVGHAIIKNGTLKLDKMSLKAIGAEANGTIRYQNVMRTGANVAINMELEGADINRIGELVPSINTMFPILESFEGIVDFAFKANTNINSDATIDISTLSSAMMFKGRDLVLMDSQTFDDLSKMLMFKNKDRNMIDSIEAYALVEESKVDVLPFQMDIDRYQAIIGGTQTVDPETFDIDYAYNVSIIKSPLPFKAGVDIKGDLNDFKFKITSAKLKKTDFDKQRQIYEAYRDNILDSIVVNKDNAQRRRREQIMQESQELQEQQESQIEEEEPVEDEVAAETETKTEPETEPLNQEEIK